MDRIRRFLPLIGMEPVIFLYIFSAYLKYPVFQSLVFEKICVDHYGSSIDCTNTSQTAGNTEIQAEANHFILLSAFFLLTPALFSAILLGSLSDSWNAKFPMLVPFVGLIIADLNYLYQISMPNNSIYFLLISDLIYGICGSGSAVIATLLSYNIKTSSPEIKSEKIAAFEGVAGLGITMGYACSGIIREHVGYSYCFLIFMFIHAAAFFYVIVFAKELDMEHEDDPLLSETSIASRFKEVFQFVLSYRNSPLFKILAFSLISLSIELFINSGTSDIMFSYLRFKLSWNDKPFGWFFGLGNAFNSIACLFLYPLLHRRYGMNDCSLTIFGLITQISFLFMFAFLFSHWWTYLSLIPMTFNRFALTGLRATSSSLVKYEEQGKLFSLIALTDGITSIFGTIIFNGLYPLTLSFYSGLVFFISAALLFIPVALMINVNSKKISLEPERTPLYPPLSPVATVAEEDD